MKRLLPLLLLLLASLGDVRGQQPMRAKLLMRDQRVMEVLLHPRKPGTTLVRVEFVHEQGEQTLNLADIEQFAFDLAAFHPSTLQQLYLLGKYDAVIESLKGRVIPFFGFADQNSNSNELVKLFIKALYQAGNHQGVVLAAEEVDKYTPAGEVHRMAHLYKALSYLETGRKKKFEELKYLFDTTDLEDPLAPVIWYGQAKMALAKDDWEAAYPPLARIVTEAPMDTDWAPEALYLTAVYHHSVTNLVVANQICQEISIVASLTDWPEKAIELNEKIVAQAKELEIELVDWGGYREKAAAGEDQSEIDYRERQRALEREETERLLQELNQGSPGGTP